jgi:opacity protein-like surface antigen
LIAKSFLNQKLINTFGDKNNPMRTKNLLITPVLICLISLNSLAENDKTMLDNEPTQELTNDLAEHHPEYAIAGRRNRNVYKKGDQIISIGYGIPNFTRLTYKDIVNSNSNTELSGLGPIYLKYEYALSNHFGLGLSSNFATSNITYPVNNFAYEQKLISIAAVARVNYHFGTTTRFDPYAGLGLGYRYSSITLTTGEDTASVSKPIGGPSSLGIEVTIGSRFYLNKAFGFYAELGLGQSVLNGGVVFKF